MFKSALYPALLEFHVEGTMQSGTQASKGDERISLSEKSKQYASDERLVSYKVIVNTDDNLRQDQLIIMMILLMDVLLKGGALDLCFDSLLDHCHMSELGARGVCRPLHADIPGLVQVQRLNYAVLPVCCSTERCQV